MDLSFSGFFSLTNFMIFLIPDFPGYGVGIEVEVGIIVGVGVKIGLGLKFVLELGFGLGLGFELVWN